MLDLLQKEIIQEKLDTHIANFFDTDTATEGLSKALIASSPFIAFIATV